MNSLLLILWMSVTADDGVFSRCFSLFSTAQSRLTQREAVVIPPLAKPPNPSDLSLEKLRALTAGRFSEQVVEVLFDEDAVSSRILRPAIFDFVLELDQFVQQQRIELKTTNGRSELKIGTSTTEFKTREQAVAHLIGLFAQSKLTSASRDIQEELARFQRLVQDPQYDSKSLARWLSFQILSYRMKLLETDPPVFLRHLQELSALEFAGSVIETPARFRLGSEAPIFIDDQLQVAMDITVSGMEKDIPFVSTSSNKAPLDFYEVKQPNKFEKASDLRPSIRSAIEAANTPLPLQRNSVGPYFEFSGIRYFFVDRESGNSIRTPDSLDLTNLTPRSFSEGFHLILQVDWSFENDIEWQIQKSRLTRTPTGEILSNGRGVGNILADVEKMLPTIPDHSQLTTIFLTGKDGTPIATFFNTHVYRQDQAFLQVMKDDHPDFYHLLMTQDWLMVPGVLKHMYDESTGGSLAIFSREQLISFRTSPTVEAPELTEQP